MARIRLTQIDGSLPNLALMKLGHYFKSMGKEVFVTRALHRDLFEPDYDRVYASAIFMFSKPRLDQFISQWPQAIVGGTGTTNLASVEDIVGGEYEHYDYSGWPSFSESIGFTQRGCRPQMRVLCCSQERRETQKRKYDPRYLARRALA